ncbi:MAG: cytochrome c oxidase subunit 4 [Propionicimonas sp.]|nr:cytochrome c oxidase subunit 4 [Propionicimonas sp.]
MKAETWIFAALAVFMAVVAPIYWLMSHEVIGSVALALTFAFIATLTVYLWIQSRKMDPRLEDRKDAEIVEGAGELGFFPPASIWPFWTALVVTIMALGPVFGWWLTILGAAFGVLAVTGWCYEYYRGDYQH